MKPIIIRRIGRAFYVVPEIPGEPVATLDELWEQLGNPATITLTIDGRSW